MSIDEIKVRDEIQKTLFEKYNLCELIIFGSRGYDDSKFNDPKQGILLFSRDVDKPCECVPLDLIYCEEKIYNLHDIMAWRNRLGANSYIMGRGSLVETKEIKREIININVKGIEVMLFPMALYKSNRAKTK